MHGNNSYVTLYYIAVLVGILISINSQLFMHNYASILYTILTMTVHD